MATGIDASGTTVTLARPPRRIVSLIPSTTELLCALGLADAIVGVSAYCIEPRDVVKSKARVGGEKNPDLAAIRALQPDLVIANIEENERRDIEALRASSIPIWVTYPKTIADTLAMTRELGELLGAEVAARALVGALEHALATVRERTANRPPTPVYYPIWREPWMTVGGDTYISDVLKACGGANVFAAETRYPRVTLEEVAARMPAVILLPDEPFRFRRAHVQEFGPYTSVPAVRDARIHLIDGKLCAWHGPRLVDALHILPPLLGHG